jgi:hypothetical protein
MTRWLLGIEEAGSGRSDVPGLRACSTQVRWQRIGEFQHEARSRYSASGEWPWSPNRCQRGGSDSGRGALAS